ncbi:MAG: UDP-N-acetylmuramate dehydrogenase, partial [Deltaproteobacteria bacterium]
VLFSDAGFRGVVISFQEGFGNFTLLPDGVTIEAECGVPVSALVQFSRKAGLTGLEAAAGIPGSVGGACFMNAGTHEGNFAGLVTRLELIDLEGRRYRRNREELDFSYRHLALPPQAIILEAWLHLRPGNPETITKRIQGILQRRKASQPLTLPNAGSIFKNPPGDFAGRLVEAAGLKGSRIGDAQVSERHANFIVNRGNASAADIVALIELVRKRVLEASGIALEPEVKVIGERGLYGH